MRKLFVLFLFAWMISGCTSNVYTEIAADDKAEEETSISRQDDKQ
jgi:uncharacterized protein YceK